MICMLCLVSCAQEIAKTVENIVGASLLWRGDLSPIDCEAIVKTVNAFRLWIAVIGFGAASHPIGDKSPHHKSPFPHWFCCVLRSL